MNGAFDPRLLDLALVLIALEGLAFVALRGLAGVGPRPVGLIANLAAGACLILVARSLMMGANPFATGAALTGALLAHGVDLIARWERAAKPTR